MHPNPEQSAATHHNPRLAAAAFGTVAAQRGTLSEHGRPGDFRDESTGRSQAA